MGAQYHFSNTLTSDVRWAHSIPPQHNRLECSRKNKVIRKFKNWMCARLLESYGVYVLCCRRRDSLVECMPWYSALGRRSNATRCDKLLRLSARGDLDIVTLLHKNVTSNEAFRRVELLQSFHLKHLAFLTLWSWPCPVGLYLFWWLNNTFGHCQF